MRAARRFFGWFDIVNAQTLRADLFAGITNAIIVLPQGIAYALIAGLPPEYGLYAAMVPAMIAAVLGSSWHLISGPTAALSIVVFSVAGQHAEPGTDTYVETVLALTLLVGVFQLLLTLGNLGKLIDFVSHTVVIGFTAGAGALIFTNQLRHVLGIDLPDGLSFWQTLSHLYGSVSLADPSSVTVALSVLAVTFGLQRFSPRSPHMAAGLVAGALVAAALDAGDGALRMVGEIPQSLPPFRIPDIDPATAFEMLPGVAAVGLLGLVEAVSIARAIATRSGQLISGNREFFGQGMSNLVGSLFSCYVSSGSFTRSGVNYDSGARTPLSGIFAGLALAVVVVAFAPLAARLPLAAMGSILLIVAYRLLLWGHIRTIVQTSKADTVVLGATFFSVLFLPLEAAIYIGIATSLAIYAFRAPRPWTMRMEMEESFGDDKVVARLNGPLFFGVVARVSSRIRSCDKPFVVLAVDGISYIDVAGAEMLVMEARRCAGKGGGLLLCGLRPDTRRTLERGGFINAFDGMFFENIPSALDAVSGIAPQPMRIHRIE